jgi:hypothetical protein
MLLLMERNGVHSIGMCTARGSLLIDSDRRERPTARQAGDTGKKNFKRRKIGEKQEVENLK